MKVLATLFAITQAADTFSEELKIWRFTDQLSLMSFQFDFDLESTSDRSLDYFPAQFYELVRKVP